MKYVCLLLTTALVTSHETGVPETLANTAATPCQNERSLVSNELTTTERIETSLGVFSVKMLKRRFLYWLVSLIYQHQESSFSSG